MCEDGLVPKDTRVFKCKHCGKDFQGEIAKHSLQRHIQSNHLRTYSLSLATTTKYCL